MASKFTYDNFRSRVKDEGLALQNKFEVLIAPPKKLTNFDTDGTKLHLWCKSVQAPGVNIATSQERLTGEIIEMPYDRNFGPAVLTFFTPNTFENKKIFDKWMDIIQDPTTRTIGYYDDYISEKIEIDVINKEENYSYRKTLWKAHPKSIGGLNLDSDSTGVYTFDVVFDYQYYTTEIL